MPTLGEILFKLICILWFGVAGLLALYGAAVTYLLMNDPGNGLTPAQNAWAIATLIAAPVICAAATLVPWRLQARRPWLAWPALALPLVSLPVWGVGALLGQVAMFQGAG